MKSAQSSPIVVVGSVNFDVTYNMPELPLAGETVLASGRRDAPGGKGANQAVSIASYGLPVSLVFCVGDDNQGGKLVDLLKLRGVDTSHVFQATNQATGSAIILVDEHGENSIVVDPGANYSLTPDAASSAISKIQPEFVLAQLEVPVEAVIAAARANAGTFILNPAPIPRDLSTDQIKSLLEHSDILVPNRSELASLTGMPVPQSSHQIHECVAKLEFSGTLIVTLGADGALLFPDAQQVQSIQIPAPQVTATDASGAGDAFCASLVACLQTGKSLIEAVTHACKFASWSTTQIGAQVSPEHGFTLS
ncbi:MAG: ribokinase [Candidatus Nanopelagicales bacterium]|nr:ribokinase [Candidatus Nanopelagicales bacterium]